MQQRHENQRVDQARAYVQIGAATVYGPANPSAVDQIKLENEALKYVRLRAMPITNERAISVSVTATATATK